MIHPIHEKYAHLLVNYCCNVQAGEYVSLNIEEAALAMARPLFREVLRVGAKPVLHIAYAEMLEDLYELASDAFLDSEATLELSEIKQVHSWIRVNGSSNTKALQNANKDTMSRILKRTRDFQNIRIRQTKWVGTLFPTQAGAQAADMSLSEYEDFVFNAMYLYEDDPVSKWLEIKEQNARVIDRLKDANELHIVAEGTDLKLRTQGRTWVNSHGKRNMPCGEVFTGPIEDSANGVISFAIPTNYRGIDVENIRVRFEDGKAIEFEAEKGNDAVIAALNSDDGARFLGEIGIGTNYNIQRGSRSILYDEKIGGTVHLALGQSYQETGGINNSALHWDMICDLRQGGALYADGELIQENGRFLL